MSMSRRIDKLKEVTSDSLLVPNVRDAVFGLPPGSSLAGPVEFYGERSLVLPAAAAVRKQARNSREARNMEIHRCFLERLGVGTKTIYDIPAPEGEDTGIVARLHRLSREEVVKMVQGRKLNFFINTAEAERLGWRTGSPVAGPRARMSQYCNNKLMQRRLGAGLNGSLFPLHHLVANKEEMIQAFEKVARSGQVVGKVGHLASGEGMELLETSGQAVSFWEKWSRVLQQHRMEEAVIVEEKKRLRPGINSVSTQFVLDEQGIHYIGPSIQYVTGFSHTGNRVGKEVTEVLEPWVEEKAVQKSLDFLGLDSRLLPASPSVIGFDFIVTEEEEVLMVECNFRCTASTLLFALEFQLGSHLTYDLLKMKFPRPLKRDFKELVEELEKVNTGPDKVIPLNPRLFEETGEMFVAAASLSGLGIERLKERVYNMFI